MFQYHHGKAGAYTEDQAEGAMPNGARVRKVNSERGDSRPDGAVGIVLGSIDAAALIPEEAGRIGIRFLYFVEWDDRPLAAVAIIDRKVEQIVAEPDTSDIPEANEDWFKAAKLRVPKE